MKTTIQKIALCLPVELHGQHVSALHTFKSMGMDSLEFIDFLFRVEYTFGVSIPNRDARAFNTFGDMQKWLEEKLCS